MDATRVAETVAATVAPKATTWRVRGSQAATAVAMARQAGVGGSRAGSEDQAGRRGRAGVRVEQVAVPKATVVGLAGMASCLGRWCSATAENVWEKEQRSAASAAHRYLNLGRRHRCQRHHM